ncbi:MAG: response regulator [Sporomusaceae bacterium]|nr:response regulator [Sporomusaceae bacterium]
MKHILLCDDSLFVRTHEKNILEKSGRYQIVGEAGDGEAAIRLYFQYRPDLVLMDFTMPTMNGLAATKKIIERDPLAKIVVVSAMGQKAFFFEALKAGAINFLIKPFEDGSLLESVQKALLLPDE